VSAAEDAAGLDFVLEPLPRLSESVVVVAIRADARTPVTKDDIPREEIKRQNVGQEMPFLLEPVPSLNVYSDTGLGGGYSYLYLRGIQQTRINMTLDGVPLNEPEDSTLYFVDFGDFASSRRASRCSAASGPPAGTASYAGSINFASLDLAEKPAGSAVSGRLLRPAVPVPAASRDALARARHLRPRFVPGDRRFRRTTRGGPAQPVLRRHPPGRA
jgi:hypothetical protein